LFSQTEALVGKIQTDRLVVFDLETTGTNPERDCAIQVGALALDGDLSPCGEFESKLCFDEGRESSAAHGGNSLERAVWNREALPEREAARRFAAFLHEHATLLRAGAHGKPFLVAQLASYNSGFDGPFLNAWFERSGDFLPADRRVLCLMQRAHWALLESRRCAFPDSLKLGTVCRELGIPLGHNAHDALHDARAAASIYRVLHGLSPIPDAEPNIVSTVTRSPRSASRYESRARGKRHKHPWRGKYAARSARRRKTRVTTV
jgi:DNA polymerase III epsilon subunit-like protein